MKNFEQKLAKHAKATTADTPLSQGRDIKRIGKEEILTGLTGWSGWRMKNFEQKLAKHAKATTADTPLSQGR